MIGPHGFVPTQNDEQSCDVCSGVPGDPIHRNSVGPRAQQAAENAQRQAPEKPKGRLSAGWVFLAFAGIAVAVIAVGNFLSDGQTESGDDAANAST